MNDGIPFGSQKILCIDDDWALLRVLSIQLQSHGFLPLTAPDGPTGLALAAAERPALVLLDVLMPGMAGFEVCRRLRADPRTRAIPRVFLTALRDSKLGVRAIEAGAELALSKPYAPQELMDTLRGMLALRRGRPPS